MADQEAVAENQSGPERPQGDAPAAQPNVQPSRDARAPADTRHQILRRARDLFAKHGYRGTSIRQLTAGLNLTPAALYYHFSGKDDVLSGLLAPMERDGEAVLARIAELNRGPEALRDVLDRYYDLLARDIQVFRLVADDVAVQQSAMGQRLRSQARELFAWLVGPSPDADGRIRAAAAVGTIRLSLEQRDVDPELYRETIIGRAMSIMTD